MKSTGIRLAVVLVVLLVLIYAGAVVLGQPVQDNAFLASDHTLVIAHQGGERVWPSNTMYAFDHAVDLGVDVLEMDTHATRDGVLVLMHDDTVDRTTDGTGRIADLTLSEIRALDAGHYWTEDDATFPYRDQGIGVPTLEELFQRYPDFPVNIEIKPDDVSVAEALCRLLRDYGKTDHALVGSFHANALAEFRDFCPEVATSSAETEVRVFYVLKTTYLSAAYFPQSYAFQVPEYSGDTHVVTPRFVRNAQAHNIAVHVWTVNESDDMERFLEMGVDGIITDRPDRLLALLDR